VDYLLFYHPFYLLQEFFNSVTEYHSQIGHQHI